MRIITQWGIDIPYEMVSVYANDVLEYISEDLPRGYMVRTSSMFKEQAHCDIAACDSLEKANEVVMEIAILAAKGTKLIRMRDSGEIEVVV